MASSSDISIITMIPPTCTISPTFVPSPYFANLYQLKSVFTIVTENPLRICNGATTLFVNESDIIRISLP